LGTKRIQKKDEQIAELEQEKIRVKTEDMGLRKQMEDIRSGENYSGSRRGNRASMLGRFGGTKIKKKLKGGRSRKAERGALFTTESLLQPDISEESKF
jgi:hypothetical protein